MMIQMFNFNKDSTMTLENIVLPPYIDSTTLLDFLNNDYGPHELRAITRFLEVVKRKSCTHQKNY